LIRIFKTILADSTTPPVIVIQADHIWTENDKDWVKILNGYYLLDTSIVIDQKYPNRALDAPPSCMNKTWQN